MAISDSHRLLSFVEQLFYSVTSLEVAENQRVALTGAIARGMVGAQGGIAMNKYSLFYDILDTVISNGRLELHTPEELEIEIEFEARERGLSEDEIAEAIAYALDHYRFD